MSRRPGPGVAPPVAVERSRLYQVLSAGQEQQKVRSEQGAATAPAPAPVTPAAPTGASLVDTVDIGTNGNDCGKNSMYCGSPYPDLLKEYIRQVKTLPAYWNQYPLKILEPYMYTDTQDAEFATAYNKYELETATASQRDTSHVTMLKGKDKRKVGEMFTQQGDPANVYTVVAEAIFVDGDGPEVGIGYSYRFQLIGRTGATLGVIYGLGARNIEANDPDTDDLFFFLFVDKTVGWAMQPLPVVTAPVPENINVGPPRWNQDLKNAMEFATFWSLRYLTKQFTRV